MMERAIAAYALMAFAVIGAVFAVDRLLDARRRRCHHRSDW